MIELKNVSKYYHSGDITNLGLHNVSLKLNRGEIVAITGDSGSGKSTLLNVITKIDSFDEGEILFKGNETSYFSVSDMDDFRKNKIGFIFQNYNIIDSYTVLENVMLPLTLKGMKKSDAKAKALELIERVGLSHRIRSRGTKLSGGEKQRCVIARALASDCEILACDEPTGNLDSKTGDEIIKLIKEVAKDKLVLIVTHNYPQVEDIVTRKIRVADGEIVEDVSFTKVEDDIEEELDLDYVPLKRNVCAKIAKNNVVFTPRKTLLLSLIFFAICLAQLFLFQAINSSYSNIEADSVYMNQSKERLVVFDSHHNVVDEALLSGYDYDVNSFNEDFSARCNMNYSTGPSDEFYYTDRISYKLKDGEMPSKDNEIILLFPKYKLYNFTNNDPLGQKVYILGEMFTVSGYAYGDNTDYPYDFVITGSAKAKTYFRNYLFLENINRISTENSSSLKLSYQVDKNITKPYIEASKEQIQEKSKLMLFELYDVTSSFEVKEVSGAQGYTIHFNPANELELPTFEVSIYTKNVKSNKSKLVEKGLSVDIASQTTNQSKAMVIIQNFFSYLIMGFSCIILLIVFLITYVILAKVYQSKKKDYEILRTLGVTKKDMRKIVDYEVIGVCGVVQIFTLIIFIIMIKTIPDLQYISKIRVGTILIYLGATMLFAICLAKRFNRRLFKFSVTKSMKGDVKHD